MNIRGIFKNWFREEAKQLAYKPSKVEIKLDKISENLYRKELDEWLEARMLRKQVGYETTWMLQELYNDSMLDTHLTAAVRNRILRIVNKQFVVKDLNNNRLIEKEFIFKEKWFFDLVVYALESHFYGYSLIFLKELQNKRINDIELIDRRHVIPERKIIVQSLSDFDGLLYEQFPDMLLYAQFGDNAIGLLEKAAPLTILKRHSWASWDEFEQLFGIPIRIARTFDQSTKHRNELEGWLQNMGQSSYAVLPKTVDLEIKENSRSDAFNVYDKKIDKVNSEISKLVNGQTMTMDAGSSRSQSEVHERTEDEITVADCKLLISWLNTVLLPVLQKLDYGLKEGYYIDIYENKTLNATEKIKVDDILMRNGCNLDKTYLETTYDVKIKDITKFNNNLDYDFFD